jgi:hypothetical protein
MRKLTKPSPAASPLLFELDPEPLQEALTVLGGIPLVVQVFAMNQAQRYLDKSISGDDLTNNFKLAWIYELPLGKGKRYVTSGVGSALLGNWRVAAIQYYSSG